MMNLSDMFRKPATRPGEDFPEMQEAMAELLDLELDAPTMETEDPEGPETMQADGESPSDPPRLTAHAQSRLAALKAFDELQRSTGEELDRLGAALTRVNATRHTMREFLGSLHTSVYRANEIELARDMLIAENRRLSQEVEQVKRLRAQNETLIETNKRREARLAQENDTLKVDLGRIGLEANDAQNRILALEAERADLLNTVAVKSSAAERHARENEILREKQINLSLDLENTQRLQTEAERKLSELTSVHNTESAQLAELRARLSASEKEAGRQQKQHDALLMQLEEVQDRLQTAETGAEDAAREHEAGMGKLTGEIETLKTRLEAAGKAQVDVEDELGVARQRLAEAVAERKFAEDRLAALRHDYVAERAAGSEPVADGDTETE